MANIKRGNLLLAKVTISVKARLGIFIPKEQTMQKRKPNLRLIFRMWFRHKKTGKIIYTGRPIPMWVKA